MTPIKRGTARRLGLDRPKWPAPPPVTPLAAQLRPHWEELERALASLFLRLQGQDR